jgi:hypothetical protein
MKKRPDRGVFYGLEKQKIAAFGSSYTGLIYTL